MNVYTGQRYVYEDRKSAYNDSVFAGKSEEVIDKAKKALVAAENALKEEYEALVATDADVMKAASEINDAFDSIDDKISEVRLAKAILSSTDPELEAEATKLQYELNLVNAAENALGNDDLSDFEEALEQAKADVETAKANVAAAQLKLDQFYEGSYSAADYVKQVKLDLDEAKKSRDEAKATYDYYSELYKSTVAKLSAE